MVTRGSRGERGSTSTPTVDAPLQIRRTHVFFLTDVCSHQRHRVTSRIRARGLLHQSQLRRQPQDQESKDSAHIRYPETDALRAPCSMGSEVRALGGHEIKGGKQSTRDRGLS